MLTLVVKKKIVIYNIDIFCFGSFNFGQKPRISPGCLYSLQSISFEKLLRYKDLKIPLCEYDISGLSGSTVI